MGVNYAINKSLKNIYLTYVCIINFQLNFVGILHYKNNNCFNFYWSIEYWYIKIILTGAFWSHNYSIICVKWVFSARKTLLSGVTTLRILSVVCLVTLWTRNIFSLNFIKIFVESFSPFARIYLLYMYYVYYIIWTFFFGNLPSYRYNLTEILRNYVRLIFTLKILNILNKSL